MLMNADEASDTNSSIEFIGGYSNNTVTGASYIDICTYLHTYIQYCIGPVSVVQSIESRVYLHTYL